MTKATLRGQYRGLSNQELTDKAYELGFNFEKYSHSCSQCVVATFNELLDIDDVVVRVATSLEGGSAMQFLGTCGALSGGIMTLDYFFGRPKEHMSHTELIQANVDEMYTASELPRLLAERYWKQYGTITCIEIQRQLFGRFYYALDPDDMQKLEKANVYSDPTKCSNVVGTAARWTMEILLDRNAIES